MKGLILFFIFITQLSFAATEDFFLQAGLNAGPIQIKTSGDRNQSAGGGFTTHFGYDFKNFDVMASSYVFLSKFHYAALVENGESFNGPIKYQSVGFGPMVRAKFIDCETMTNWTPTIQFGYLWSLLTVRPDVDDFDKGQKLTYNAKGAVIGVGLIQKNRERPFFFEFVYKELKAFSVARVEKVDELTVETIRKGGLTHKFVEQSIMFVIGYNFL